jgi:hypothetical protein
MKLQKLAVLAALAFGLAVARGAAADTDAHLYVVKPLANGTVTITVSANGATQTTTVNILATDSAADKRRKIREALGKNGYCTRTIIDRRGTAIWITDLPDGARVTFDPGKTGERADQLFAPASLRYLYGFRGSLNGTGADGAQASFTAGVATSRGEVTVELLADEIAPGAASVPGSLVAARLHEALAPAAAGIGAVLTLAGEEIEASFDDPADPEKSVSFGTTAESEGVSATAELAGEPAPAPDCDADPLACAPKVCTVEPEPEPTDETEPAGDTEPVGDHDTEPVFDTEPVGNTEPIGDTGPVDETEGTEETDTDGGQVSRVCVWSCQYNTNFGTWKYWFAPHLSSCPVTQCQPRNGNSPSGTPCNQGDPDIPGTCVP